MPDCMVVVKRNLDREDGFEEVYLNKAFKNKKSLTDNFESNVLLKIFRDRYDGNIGYFCGDKKGRDNFFVQ